jgi:hypothetical protein
MYKNLFLLILIGVFLGCDRKIAVQKSHSSKDSVQKNIEIIPLQNHLTDNLKILEEDFVDSLNIGKTGNFKLDFKKYRSDSTWVELKFFEKKDSKWILKNDMILKKDGVIGCDVAVKDFNNDDFNDFTFKSAVAARGANEVRTLLIFDVKKGKLRHMKNSERFPNLGYNRKLNCIDAQAFYGGSTTYFLKIEQDSLREFASISSFDNQIEINLIDKKGKQKLLKRLPIGEEDVYNRYSNYQPLEVSNEE